MSDNAPTYLMRELAAAFLPVTLRRVSFSFFLSFFLSLYFVSLSQPARASALLLQRRRSKHSHQEGAV